MPACLPACLPVCVPMGLLILEQSLKGAAINEPGDHRPLSASVRPAGTHSKLEQMKTRDLFTFIFF